MPLTAGEKLITALLCDISKKLGAEQEIDPDFVKSALSSKYQWALKWEYEWLFDEDDFDSPAELDETVDILFMWDVIEAIYEKFTDEEKAYIKEQAEPFGDSPSFGGFDGNNESHYGIARFLLEDLDRFPRFKDRDLNCHCPSIDSHQRMLRVYNTIKQSKEWHDATFTPQEITEILKAYAHSYAFKD